MNDEVKPDLVVNLGDDIEDESREADLARYGECQAILRTARAPLVNVAGNHDLIHLNRDDLNRFWQRSGPLYYSFDLGGWHFVVLHTIERQDVDDPRAGDADRVAARRPRGGQGPDGRPHAPLGERAGRRRTRGGGRGGRTWRS